MARPRKIDHDELRRLHRLYLKGEIETYQEIADHFGASVSTINNLMRELGLTRRSLRHKDFIPWTVAKEHQLTPPTEKLRALSTAAQGKKLSPSPIRHQERLNSAINWADEILEKGMDVDYDENHGPSEISPKGGFFLRPADPDNWFLQKRMAWVRSALMRQQ